MSGDNPFAEPDDDDHTVIIPRHRIASAAPASASAKVEAVADDGTLDRHFASLARAGGSPVLSAASPLLSLLVGLRNLVSVPDPGALRTRAVGEIRRFEQTLRDRSIPIDLIRMSHYALCASLDDVVQATPWGSSGAWADASLVSTFHQEVRSGDRFFELLARLRESPARFLPVIELMYLCMSLGMRGRYRLSPRGPAEHDRVREDTYLVILQHRGAAEKELSPRWRGAALPYRAPRAGLPLWLAALAAAGLVGALFVWTTLDLNTASDALFGRAVALPPTAMPTIARPAPVGPVLPVTVPSGGRDTLARFLAPEIRAGLVTVAGTEANPIVRLQSNGMFDLGSARLLPRFVPVLDRVADAIRARGGPVQVIGYTDDQPIHTMAFPSNYQLSLARARAAAAVLGRTIERDRISVAGLADADPIASNATAAGRQENRRVEIVCGSR